MRNLFIAAAGCAVGLAMAPAASATVVLSDTFDGEVADDLNWDGDAVFFVSTGAVDLIGAGGAFDLYPGNGRYLDLDGSTSGNDPAGEITSFASFGAGTYTLNFQLGGNARGGPARTTRVTLGDFSVDITLASGDPLANYQFTFSTTGGQLAFRQLGPTNFVGNILDDVVLTGIPEPATWAMMILGFGAAGGLLRRRAFATA
jgi:hypothetical protein